MKESKKFEKLKNVLATSDNSVEIINDFNRFEVIDENGRAYTRARGVRKLSFSIQDDGKTLKIFVN